MNTIAPSRRGNAAGPASDEPRTHTPEAAMGSDEARPAANSDGGTPAIGDGGTPAADQGGTPVADQGGTPTADQGGTPAAGQGPGPLPADRPSTIAEMRGEIDAIDAELLRLIQRRTELSRAIGAARASEGGTRIVYSREMKILERFAALGPAGTDLGMLLLSMGRGKLGRR